MDRIERTTLFVKSFVEGWKHSSPSNSIQVDKELESYIREVSTPNFLDRLETRWKEIQTWAKSIPPGSDPQVVGKNAKAVLPDRRVDLIHGLLHKIIYEDPETTTSRVMI